MANNRPETPNQGVLVSGPGPNTSKGVKTPLMGKQGRFRGALTDGKGVNPAKPGPGRFTALATSTKSAIERTEAIVETNAQRMCELLVIHQQDVEFIKVRSTEAATRYEIRVNGEDTRRIIGHNGDRFRALRYIIGMIGSARHREIVLARVLEPVKGRRTDLSDIGYREDWDKQSVVDLALLTASNILYPEYPLVELCEWTEGNATITIGTSRSERFIEDAVRALTVIFHGIGGLCGCDIVIESQKV